MDDSHDDSQDEGYGSDSQLVFVRDEIRYITWHEPDDDFENTKCITDLKKQLDDAFDIVDKSNDFLPDVNAASASCAWLMSALLQAAFRRAGASTSAPMELKVDVTNLTQRVHALETYKSGLDEYKTLETKQIKTLFESDNLRRKDINFYTTAVQRLSGKLEEATKELDDTKNLLRMTRNQVDQIEQLVLALPTEAPRKWSFWHAKMPPETRTLPELLAQLTRPDRQ